MKNLKKSEMLEIVKDYHTEATERLYATEKNAFMIDEFVDKLLVMVNGKVDHDTRIALNNFIWNYRYAWGAMEHFNIVSDLQSELLGNKPLIGRKNK